MACTGPGGKIVELLNIGILKIEQEFEDKGTNHGEKDEIVDIYKKINDMCADDDDFKSAKSQQDLATPLEFSLSSKTKSFNYSDSFALQKVTSTKSTMLLNIESSWDLDSNMSFVSEDVCELDADPDTEQSPKKEATFDEFSIDKSSLDVEMPTEINYGEDVSVEEITKRIDNIILADDNSLSGGEQTKNDRQIDFQPDLDGTAGEEDCTAAHRKMDFETNEDIGDDVAVEAMQFRSSSETREEQELALEKAAEEEEEQKNFAKMKDQLQQKRKAAEEVQLNQVKEEYDHFKPRVIENQDTVMAPQTCKELQDNAAFGGNDTNERDNTVKANEKIRGVDEESKSLEEILQEAYEVKKEAHQLTTSRKLRSSLSPKRPTLYISVPKDEKRRRAMNKGKNQKSSKPIKNCTRTVAKVKTGPAFERPHKLGRAKQLEGQKRNKLPSPLEKSSTRKKPLEKSSTRKKKSTNQKSAMHSKDKCTSKEKGSVSVFDRLNNLGKSKQMEGKIRREEIKKRQQENERIRMGKMDRKKYTNTNTKKSPGQKKKKTTEPRESYAESTKNNSDSVFTRLYKLCKNKQAEGKRRREEIKNRSVR